MAAADGTLRIGLIADIQYADADDGTDFLGKERRYFRNSLNIVESAVGTWNAFGMDVIVQVGDIIDGINAKMGTSEAALGKTLDVLSRSTAQRRLDMVGNHELYTFNRPSLQRSCGLHFPGADGLFYYCEHLNSNWDAIVLDPFEIAMIGHAKDDPRYIEAISLMERNNPRVLSGPGGNWFEGLPREKWRWVPYNGAVSNEQLLWLRQMLEIARSDRRSVLVFTHIPLLEQASKPETILWNSEEVLSVLHDFADNVVAVIAGHDHGGGYAVDPLGIHHVTMNSPLTATPGNDCFAILECHDGWAQFMAHGRACSESGKEGQGGYYPELTLAKGVVNSLAF